MTAVVIAITMMKTTATTPPMMAAVLSEVDTDGTIDAGGVDMLSFTDAGTAN